MWALATFSAKPSDAGGKDASFGLNHVTCIFDYQSILKNLCHGPVCIGTEEMNVTSDLDISLASHFVIKQLVKQKILY